MKANIKKRTVRKNTPKSFVSRCENEINDSLLELKEYFPKFAKSIGGLLLAIAIISCDLIRIIFYASLKALVLIPNALDAFLEKAFARNKNGQILSILVKLTLVVALFVLFFSIISNITFPIGKLAVLNLSVRGCNRPDELVGLLEQKSRIYEAGGITGWIACKSAIEKIFFWIFSVYILTMTGITISKISFSAIQIKGFPKAKKKAKGCLT